MNFSVLILLIAIILFGVLAFRQMSALILAPVVTIFVIVLSGMPILDTLLQHFMPATSDYITKYFLIFFVGALLVQSISSQGRRNPLHAPWDASAAIILSLP